ncbi:hypothetical protein HU200_055315 [Digitaria exilis]|uniref:Uncharacterized protein n=1 Tax=Digitaria exilis TaxID=1010633 RepID=A0A835AN78_9POAL|nr:hypothetical protein HU200_055315 [Digitaria exilis]
MLIVDGVFTVILLPCFLNLFVPIAVLQVKANKRYAGASNWTVKEVAETVKNDFGSIDILVHSLANGPESFLQKQHLRVIQEYALLYENLHMPYGASAVYINSDSIFQFRPSCPPYMLSESVITCLIDEVGNTAAFLVSPLASAVTGSTIYVDNGLNTMGLALDSPTLST